MDDVGLRLVPGDRPGETLKRLRELGPDGASRFRLDERKPALARAFEKFKV